MRTNTATRTVPMQTAVMMAKYDVALPFFFGLPLSSGRPSGDKCTPPSRAIKSESGKADGIMVGRELGVGFCDGL